jgi:hypothetical protein
MFFKNIHASYILKITAGTAFIGIGFGNSMYNADMIIGWVDDTDGNPTIGDYYSSSENTPNFDTDLGGTDDVTLLGGSKTSNATTLTFIRELDTGDSKYDKVISTTMPNDMIYAWASNANAHLVYHGDNHNHVLVNFANVNGSP